MKIFIASSKESIDLMREIEVWIQEANHEPLPWDKPGLFPPGEQTFLTLINISKQIDGAICVFGEDDNIWYRGDAATQPRDNVLIEYGLFVGALGPTKAIICRQGTPKHSTDLQGITFIDLNQERKARGRMELIYWAKRLNSSPIDPALVKLYGRIGVLEKEKEALEQRISFEREKSKDLETLLKRENIIDFTNIDLKKDGYWKLLYKQNFFEGTANILTQECRRTVDLELLIVNSGAKDVANKIAWDTNYGVDRIIFLARKVLRVFRIYFDSEIFSQFINEVPNYIRDKINELAYSVIAKQDFSDMERD